MSKKKSPIPEFQHSIIETHCHLDYLKGEELEEVLQRSKDVGIERIITIAVSPDNLDKVEKLAERSNIWGTQGIHPHDAEKYDESVAATIRSRLDNPKIVAVGEIGLDYYYDHADRLIQQDVFEQQLQIAVDNDMPVVIHTRDADEDMQRILKEYAPQLKRKGVIHSFTSGLPLAEFCLEQGFMIGFNGIATFNNADNVREVVSITPLEQLLLETDSPYLTPVPYRGRPNAPFYLPFIAERIAEVKGCDVELLLKHAWNNSMKLFFPVD